MIPLARSLTSAVKPKILYYGISEMIDPSITGRASLAWSFEEHEERRGEMETKEDEAGRELEIVEEERRVEKKKRSQG